jgi:hypothetical protein
LEVVLREFDTLPAIVSIRYGRNDSLRIILVPLDRQDFGPPSGLIDLPQLTDGMPWEASSPLPVAKNSLWPTEILVSSILAAVNGTTRDAWRQIRGIIIDSDTKRIIDKALT